MRTWENTHGAFGGCAGLRRSLESTRLKVRAFNRAGDQQTTELWNRGGYMRNVIEQIAVEAV